MLSWLHRATIAARTQLWGGWRVVSLAPTDFDTCCISLNAAPVEAAETLAGLWDGAPRVWRQAAMQGVADHSRIVATAGVRQPSYVHDRIIYPLAQLGYLRLAGATVFPRTGLVMPEPGVVLRNDQRLWSADHRLLPGLLEFTPERLTVQRRALRPSRRIQQTVLVLCHVFEHNYGHWLLDCLPRLLPWRRLLRQQRLAVLVRPLQDYQRRTLELLGVPPSAIIEASEPAILCDDAIIPGLTPVQHVPDMPYGTPGSAMTETIAALQGGVDVPATGEAGRLIYVSRRDVPSFRTLDNEGAVEAAMAKLGFTVMHPQTMTFDEQIATFAQACVIAGPHGAGLTNAVFAPPGGLVIDIIPETWGTNWMRRLTQVFGHFYMPTVHPCDPAKSVPILLDQTVIAQSHVFTVDVGPFAAVVADAVRRFGGASPGNADAARHA
jgi:capsular polysaccharide biosynthesis protein